MKTSTDPRVIAARAPQEHPDARDAAYLDWIADHLFNPRWNGVIDSGSRMQWSIAPDYRHKTQLMVGSTFREAIKAAMAAQGENK